MQLNTPIKIIYILGSGHSGSTLLDLILGSHSGIESGGEIHKFEQYMSDSSTRPEEKRICTCGVHVNDCEYWVKVRSKLKRSYGTYEINLQSDDSMEFEENNYNVIRAILEVSGKEIFCDSSKGFTRLQKFLGSELFDVFVVHIIRDGRAVAFSLKRKGSNYYEVLSNWQKANKKIYLKIQKRNIRYIGLKYEDLVDDPQKHISKTLKEVNLKFEKDQLQFWKFVHHNLAGNRMRMKDEQEIKRDTQYIKKLSRKEWWFGTISAFSELKLFGYCLRRDNNKFQDL